MSCSGEGDARNAWPVAWSVAWSVACFAASSRNARYFRWLRLALLLVLLAPSEGCRAMRRRGPRAVKARSCEQLRPLIFEDRRAHLREQCAFSTGAHAEQTLGTSPAFRRALPIHNVLIVMQENRSFDHVLGMLPEASHKEVDGLPRGVQVPTSEGTNLAPFHLPRTCLSEDPPHQWLAMHTAWNEGKQDGFVRAATTLTSDGHYVLGYYDQHDLPFYYYLARTYAVADRYFAPVLSGTWPNRNFLYAATSGHVTYTGQDTLAAAPTIFDRLDAASVDWAIYTDGYPRQDSLGWTRDSPRMKHVHSIAELHDRLRAGTVPKVAFVDPGPAEDEHPPNDVQRGEAWFRRIYLSAVSSPQWMHLAMLFTYDEAGGFFDHVPPPAACPPAPDEMLFDRRGFRVPFVLVSPWVRPGYVSHVVHDHTSVLRFVELLFDLPALTARDANADALLDFFDFRCPSLAKPPKDVPNAGSGGCP